MLRSAAALTALASLLAASPARADHDPFMRSFDVVPLKPTPTVGSGIALDGARAWGQGSLRAALLFDLSFNALALRRGDEKIGDLIKSRLDAHLMLGYQLHPRFDVAVDLPLVLWQGDDFGLLDDILPQEGVYSLLRPCDEPFQRGCGFADLRLIPRALLLDPDSFPVGLSLIAEVRLPTGDGLSFTGDRAATIAPRLSAERAFGPLRVIANAGYRFRRHGQFLNLYVGHEFALGAGAVYRLPDLAGLTHLEAMAEAHLATPTTAPFTFALSDSLKSPLELLVGARGRLDERWGLDLSVGRAIALESGYGRPDFRVLFGVHFMLEETDRDKDGIPDGRDRCPDDPEDRDGFEDSDGCPEKDNDRDGILDGEDRCPNEPGPRATEGCPDRDKDGVPDASDACPDTPGPKEHDGCPDKDKDDIPDNADKCPDEPGPPQNDGCPVKAPPVVVEKEQIRLNANILFETGSATIQRQSFPVLDEVAKVLRENPTLGPIRIEGHTDNRGSREFNMGLSSRRARSVMNYLVDKGVSAKRLSARGYGFDRPIATNDTPLGRARNRRVEFQIEGPK